MRRPAPASPGPYARLLVALAIGVGAGSCSDEDIEVVRPDQSTRLVFDLSVDVSREEHFFDQPWPLDTRLTAEGTPELDGWPNPDQLDMLIGFKEIGEQRTGYSMLPVSYFRFTGSLPELDLAEVVPAGADSPILLADVDADSPERGRLLPTVATMLGSDEYSQHEHVLAIAPRPGFVLRPETTYAFVVRRSLGDATGAPLGVVDTLRDLLAGIEPAGDGGAAALQAFAPLRDALGDLGLEAEDVAAATVFTTGNVVADTHALSNAVLEAHAVTIESLALDPTDGALHERFCELHGTVRYPQFQRGTPPFDTEGTFVIGADGLPELQREEEAPVVITIPKGSMPRAGFPLMIYFHGSGGLAAQVVDRGPNSGPDDEQEVGKGPAHVVAEHGFATAASALPLNPERLPGAEDTEYLNIDNLKAFRDTFRQGVIEQRLLLEALRTLELSPELLAACAGPTLPPGATTFRFAEERVVAMGQSMGGVYINMIGPTEPRISAVVPTGAGGFWSYFILETSLLPGVDGLLGALLGTDVPLTFTHPALALLELAWEPAEPIAYVPALARRPLEGHPVRPIYEPAGKDDSYFPITIYDAMAIAYGNEQAGDEVWPSMQMALALDGRGGLLRYPVTQNVTATGSEQPYTGVVVQSAGDGKHDPHAIAFQLDEVKYQYGCFLATFVERGVATVPAPAPLGTPCP